MGHEVRDALDGVYHRGRGVSQRRRPDKRARDDRPVLFLRGGVPGGRRGHLRGRAGQGEPPARRAGAARHHADDDVRRGDPHRRRHVSRVAQEDPARARRRKPRSRADVHAVAGGDARETGSRGVRRLGWRLGGEDPRRRRHARRGDGVHRGVRLHQHFNRVLPRPLAVQRGHVPPAAEQGVQEAAGADRAAEFSPGDEGSGAVLPRNQVCGYGTGGFPVGGAAAAGDVEAVRRGPETRCRAEGDPGGGRWREPRGDGLRDLGV
mmetsp:Transcript_387/g.1572  ORF Transcript_387/g.1572 Transcript_387/m.1572 type:complete len:264 (+) Transcript_387:956-1747(+)